MVIKSFNLDEEIYEEFSKHCKKHGMSMSKKVENFIKEELESIKRIRKIKNIKSDLGNFSLELEKDTKIKPELPEPHAKEEEHSMGKYC